MLKQCMLFICFSSVLNLQAIHNALRYIPANSKVREYCEQNPDDKSCQDIVKFLERMSASKSNKQQRDIIDLTEKNLEKRAYLAEAKQIKGFDKYVVNPGKINLSLDKAILEENYIPQSFPQEGKDTDKTSYNDAVKDIFSTIDPKQHEQEKHYLQQGFLNAYKHETPWNTYNTNEKIFFVSAGLYGLSLIGFYIYTEFFQRR